MVKISIGQYLLNRLKEVGIDTVFGCPGDYNMPLLDLIEDDAGLTWGNNANELNASYAADGYARVRGAGAVVTTFGVGELSAANGIAGSYSEMLPVLHIVGTPHTKSQEAGAILHHSLGNGDFHVFKNMFSMITVASSHLKFDTALQSIDHVIQQAVLRKRPGYIGIPIDLINAQVDIPQMNRLDITIPPNPEKAQEACLKAVLEALQNAKSPVIIADACVLRHGISKTVENFVQRTGFPTFVAPMGKGSVDENLSNYRGCFAGSISLVSIAKEVADADLILELGAVKSDFNTGGFSYSLDEQKVISFHTFSIKVFSATYEDVSMVEFLPILAKALPPTQQMKLPPRALPEAVIPGKEITHNYFWNTVPKFMDPGAIIVAETGTSEFGVFNMELPKGATVISQILWGSIGYSVGAALGSAMADRKRRTYLFVGDGSFQMTAQEISLLLKHGLAPIVFLLNNDGYLIEKLIHGPKRKYNNFQMWNYDKTLEYMGAHLDNNHNTNVGLQAKVDNRQDLEKTLSQAQNERDKIHFIEVKMPQFDAPRELLLQVETSENR